MKNIINPLGVVSKSISSILLFSETILILVLWTIFKNSLIPSPLEVANEVLRLIQTSDLYDGLIVSLMLTFKSMFYSILISMAISYSYFIPLFKPIGMFIRTSRLLPLTGLVFLFTLLTKDGSQLKTSLLICGIVPFFVSSMISYFDSINVQEIELCKTMRMTNIRTWYEVVIIGRLDYIIETMKQNFAIAWLMITMVESLSMSQGGLGVMLIKANKYINLTQVFGLLVIIFLIGIFFDMMLGFIRTWIFPYTKIQVMK